MKVLGYNVVSATWKTTQDQADVALTSSGREEERREVKENCVNHPRNDDCTMGGETEPLWTGREDGAFSLASSSFLLTLSQ